MAQWHSRGVDRIAERIGAPVLTTNAGKGILPESHPLSLGGSIVRKSSQEALANADVVLVVGTEISAGDQFCCRRSIFRETLSASTSIQWN